MYAQLKGLKFGDTDVVLLKTLRYGEDVSFLSQIHSLFKNSLSNSLLSAISLDNELCVLSGQQIITFNSKSSG